MSEHRTHRVVIAGGGVAGLEALIALRELAGARVEVTLLAPIHEFVVRALSTAEPFGRPAPRVYDLPSICADHGAEFRRDALHAVDRALAAARLASGADLRYDSLLVALGAQPSPVYPGAITFRGLQDSPAMHDLLDDLAAGRCSRVAFVVPPGPAWPLPIYELALLTAERAAALGRVVQLTVVTPESAPLGVFGLEASRHVDEVLAASGIVVRTSCHVERIEEGTVYARPGQVETRAERVVALPRLNGPRVPGLPSDRDGFLPVDDHMLVRGAADVFAAGDGTAFAIKQGGIAAQQAGVAARAIAIRAGAPVEPSPFRPVLRSELFAGGRSTYLREVVTGGGGDSTSIAVDHALWWPPTKVAAPHLAPYLAALDAAGPRERHASGMIGR